MASAKWVLVTSVAHGLSNGAAVLVSDTGFALLDGKTFAVAVASTTSLYLLDISYAGNTSGSYPLSAYISNPDAEVITGGEISLAVNTATGLTHLAGCTVTGLGDGKVMTDMVVASNGSVTYDGYYSNVILGLPYTSILEPMGLDSGGEMGMADNQMRRIRKVFVRVQDTFGMQYGCNDLTNAVTYHDFLIRDAVGAVSNTTDLQTGVIDCELDMSYMRDPRFVLKQSNPLPMNVLGITYLYENSETQVKQNQQ